MAGARYEGQLLYLGEVGGERLHFGQLLYLGRVGGWRLRAGQLLYLGRVGGCVRRCVHITHFIKPYREPVDLGKVL